MSQLAITEEHRNIPGTVVAAMVGALDTTVEPFLAFLESVRGRGVRRVALDLSRLRYVNDIGLSLLVKAGDDLREAGGGIALYRVPAKVRIVLEMLGLDAFFAVVPDLEAAIRALFAGLEPFPRAAAPAPARRPSPPPVAPLPPHEEGRGTDGRGFWRFALANSVVVLLSCEDRWPPARPAPELVWQARVFHRREDEAARIDWIVEGTGLADGIVAWEARGHGRGKDMLVTHADVPALLARLETMP